MLTILLQADDYDDYSEPLKASDVVIGFGSISGFFIYLLVFLFILFATIFAVKAIYEKGDFLSPPKNTWLKPLSLIWNLAICAGVGFFAAAALERATPFIANEGNDFSLKLTPLFAIAALFAWVKAKGPGRKND